MKNLRITICLLLFALQASAQEKGIFVQMSLTETSFYSNQERGMELPQGPFGGFRSSTGIAVAIGKWVSPEVGLRLKMNGFGCKSVISDDSKTNSSRYWALFGDVMLDASTLLFGESESRRWEVAPYVGGGINRNHTYDEYGIGLRLGLQNSWRLDRRWGVHLDVAYSIYEPDTDGIDPHEGVVSGSSRHTLGNRDRSLGVELGITFQIGK